MPKAGTAIDRVAQFAIAMSSRPRREALPRREERRQNQAETLVLTSILIAGDNRRCINPMVRIFSRIESTSGRAALNTTMHFIGWSVFHRHHFLPSKDGIIHQWRKYSNRLRCKVVSARDRKGCCSYRIARSHACSAWCCRPGVCRLSSGRSCAKPRSSKAAFRS